MIPGGKGPSSMAIGPERKPRAMGPLDLAPPMDKADGEKTPPNLRDADGEDSCGNCQHFTGEGCSKFANYPCEADQVCDSHEPKGGEAAEMGDQASDPYEMEA